MAAMVATVLMALAGCGSQPIDRKLVAQMAGTPYPKDATVGGDLDIVVRQTRTQIELVNRTPRTYHDVQLWLNQQYLSTIKEIRIGESPSNSFDLDRFIDKHGDSFPVAGLLTPEKGAPVVLAELFDPATGQRYRLLAQPKR